MVVGQGGVWTVRFRFLFHVDPSRSEVRERIPLEFGISFSVNLAEGSDKIWVAYDGGLDEVNPATGEQREAIAFGDGPAGRQRRRGRRGFRLARWQRRAPGPFRSA